MQNKNNILFLFPERGTDFYFPYHLGNYLFFILSKNQNAIKS